jgi:MbtH protein
MGIANPKINACASILKPLNQPYGNINMAWEDDDQTVYTVVINHEEQYSIWPEWKDIPNGWKAVGKSGPKADCLAYIEKVWTDMRPLSLRKRMENVD